jgi:hypothetical protein
MQVHALVAKLGNLCIDIARDDHDDWLPDAQSLDYRSNHPVLLELCGIRLTRGTKDADIRHRCRLAVRLCHPDKLPQDASALLLARAQKWFIKLTTAKDELLQRPDWVRRRQIDPPQPRSKPSHTRRSTTPGSRGSSATSTLTAPSWPPPTFTSGTLVLWGEASRNATGPCRPRWGRQPHSWSSSATARTRVSPCSSSSSNWPASLLKKFKQWADPAESPKVPPRLLGAVRCADGRGPQT